MGIKSVVVKSRCPVSCPMGCGSACWTLSGYVCFLSRKANHQVLEVVPVAFPEPLGSLQGASATQVSRDFLSLDSVTLDLPSLSVIWAWVPLSITGPSGQCPVDTV